MKAMLDVPQKTEEKSNRSFIPWPGQQGRRCEHIRSPNPLAEEKNPIFNTQLSARKYKGIDVVGQRENYRTFSSLSRGFPDYVRSSQALLPEAKPTLAKSRHLLPGLLFVPNPAWDIACLSYYHAALFMIQAGQECSLLLWLRVSPQTQHALASQQALNHLLFT
jgi:hypothetical protein